MQRVISLRRAAIRRDQQVLQQQLERVFQHQWSRAAVVAVVARAREAWNPPTDVYETEQAIVVTVELPGMRDTTLDLTIDEYGLHLRGARRQTRPEGPAYYHQIGISYGPFELEVFIGQPFDADAVHATYDDGFLTIILPKRA